MPWFTVHATRVYRMVKSYDAEVEAESGHDAITKLESEWEDDDAPDFAEWHEEDRSLENEDSPISGISAKIARRTR